MITRICVIPVNTGQCADFSINFDISLTIKIIDWEDNKNNCMCIFVCRMPVKKFHKNL